MLDSLAVSGGVWVTAWGGGRFSVEMRSGSDRGSGNEFAEQSRISLAWTKEQDHAAQKLPLGGSGDLRLFNPLELFAAGSSYLMHM